MRERESHLNIEHPHYIWVVFFNVRPHMIQLQKRSLKFVETISFTSIFFPFIHKVIRHATRSATHLKMSGWALGHKSSP